MNIKQKLTRTAKIALVSLVGITAYNCTGSQDLNHKNFEAAQWGHYNNIDGEIWDEYIAESIPKNSDNWRIYQEEVKKRNGRTELTGKIILPDLDSNGLIGEKNKQVSVR